MPVYQEDAPKKKAIPYVNIAREGEPPYMVPFPPATGLAFSQEEWEADIAATMARLREEHGLEN